MHYYKGVAMKICEPLKISEYEDKNSNQLLEILLTDYRHTYIHSCNSRLINYDGNRDHTITSSRFQNFSGSRKLWI